MSPLVFEPHSCLITSMIRTNSIQISRSCGDYIIRFFYFYKVRPHTSSSRYFSALVLTFLFFVKHDRVCLAQETAEYSIPGYHVKHYTDENGLPQNSVKSIARDSRGNMWLATERGLVRFDGRRFVKFGALAGSYLDQNISGFYLNPEKGPGDFLAMTQNHVWMRILEGKAMVDTSLKGYPLNRSVKAVKPRNPLLIEALPDLNEKSLIHYQDYIISIYPRPNGRHFAYDEHDITYYINNKLKKQFPFPGKSFIHFFCLGDDLYYLDENLKLTCFSGRGAAVNPRGSILEGPISAHLDYRSKKYQIFWNNTTSQVFILLDKSLYFLHPAKNGALTSDLVLEGFDLTSSDIKTIYFDHETNRLFLGSQLYGLFIITKQPFRTVTAQSATPDNVYYAQTFLNDKNILTAKGTVFSLDSASLGAVAGHLKLLAKTVDWDQYSVIKDRAGYIWCKRREKLFRFDASGKRLISTWTINDEIKQLYKDHNGRIWIGTNTLGLYYIDPSEPDAHPRFFAGKHLSNISWIQHQTDEILWIGTGKGLYKIDLNTKKMSFIKGLANIYIRSLYVPDGQNEIWITTYTSGIFLLKNGKLSRLPLDKEQYLASAHCILEDKKGFFWITTNKGLFQVKRSDLLSYADKPFELYYHYYSKTAGFHTNEFNGGCQPCAISSPNGIVSMPSIDGLVWFAPKQTRPELPMQQIFVDWNPEDSTATFDHDKVTVKAGTPELTVNITTPYFGDLYNLRISYRVFKDGKPLANWKALEESMRIAIPFSGGGNYKLSIRKVNGFGVNNLGYRDLSISVKKQWFETWWFRGVAAALVLLIFYGILRQRVKKISNQNMILEAKINERTQHLEETLRILNTSGKELEQQIKTQRHLIASVTHDVRNPVRHMALALRYVQNLIENNQLEGAINAAKKIEENSERIFHLIDNMVSFIKPEAYRTISDFKSTNLSALVSERVQIFKDINGALVTVDIASDEFVNTDQKLLGVVIHNLADNAIKAKKGNKIEISAERRENELYLFFSDQGPGMPAELIDWLNTVSSEENTALPAHYEGLGLLMVKEITKILNISVHVANSPGACIRLQFRPEMFR